MYLSTVTKYLYSTPSHLCKPLSIIKCLSPDEGFCFEMTPESLQKQQQSIAVAFPFAGSRKRNDDGEGPGVSRSLLFCHMRAEPINLSAVKSLGCFMTHTPCVLRPHTLILCRVLKIRKTTFDCLEFPV